MKIKIKNATAKGYLIAEDGDSISLEHPNSKTRRGRVGKQIAQTIDTGGAIRWQYCNMDQSGS